jgi:hypothetical protein
MVLPGYTLQLKVAVHLAYLWLLLAILIHVHGEGRLDGRWSGSAGQTPSKHMYPPVEKINHNHNA